MNFLIDLSLRDIASIVSVVAMMVSHVSILSKASSSNNVLKERWLGVMWNWLDLVDATSLIWRNSAGLDNDWGWVIESSWIADI